MTKPNLESFIKNSNPHGWQNGHIMPHNFLSRHDWESKILYSVIDSLSDNNCILDYGCGPVATLRYSLYDRFPKMKYIGLDVEKPKPNNDIFPDQDYEVSTIQPELSSSQYLLSKYIEESDCIVAASVFTHINWPTIEKFLDKLESFFEKGGEFGFTIFLGNEYTLSKDPYFYYRVKENTYYFVKTTVEQYETYCEKNNLQFTLLPYSYKIDHKIGKIEHQNFCNIRRKK